MPKAYEVAAHMVRLIDASVWSGGQRLPPERELCEQFGSARNTVRNALKMLERENRVVRQPGRGSVVSMDQGSDGSGKSGDFLGDLSKASPADILELRLIVEPAAAALAAARATTDDLAEIERACVRSVAAKTFAERERWDAEFHLALFRGTRNPLLTSLCESINTVRDRSEWRDLKQQVLSQERRQKYDGQHAAVVSAITRRNGEEARSLLREHINSLCQDLLSSP